jgi:hypothetical protein
VSPRYFYERLYRQLCPKAAAATKKSSARYCFIRCQGGAAGPGYQAILERLMQASYGRTQLALDSYLDKVLLPHLDQDAGAAGQPGAGRALLALLDWAGEGYFPWQSHTEVVLLRSRAGGRHAADPDTRRGHAPFQAVRQPAGHDARRGGAAASALHPYPAPDSL